MREDGWFERPMTEDDDWFERPIIKALIKKKPLEEYSGKEIDDIFEKLAETLLTHIQSNALNTLKANREKTALFENYLWKEWEPAFDLFEIFLQSCLETGTEFNEKIKPEITDDEKYTFSALIQLYMRGCQVGFEIFTLLKNGYPDGAYARWRTLDEIAIIAMFIAEYGNDVAEAYLSHDIVESTGLDDYQRLCNTYSVHEPFTEEELTEIKSARKKMCDKFWPKFDTEYGWAANILRKKKIIGEQTKPQRKDIVKAINLEGRTSYYRMAHHSVHAGSMALYFKLGLPQELRRTQVLAGPSDFGFTDPAQCSAGSLFLLTYALVKFKPSIYRNIVLKVLDIMVDDIAHKFWEIDNRLHQQYLGSNNNKRFESSQ